MSVGVGCSITITEEKIKQYALLSGDLNPIHLDQDEAIRSGFKAPIAHGMLTMGLALEVVSSFTQEGMRVSEYEMQFIKPVFQNDTIHIVLEKVKQDSGSIFLKIVGKNGDEVVVKGEVTLL